MVDTSITKNVTPDDINNMVDPNSIVITNDYPCILGSSSGWNKVTAIVKNGVTVYQNSNGDIFQFPSGTDYSGPINLIGVDLTITDGATVNNAQIIGGYGLGGINYPVVTIEKGGRLENSSAYNHYLSIAEGGGKLS